VWRQGQSVPRTDKCLASTSRQVLDPASLSARQLRVLLSAAIYELLWGLPAVAREVRAWRAVARKIPDARIRANALSALAGKRGHTDGAALFLILAGSRDTNLLRLLVAYELIWDFLDSVNECGASAGQANGRQLHLALIEALDPGRPISDYYRYHPWRGDGGYLRALVDACRGVCGLLPSYGRARQLLIQEATRAQVLAINHDLDTARRDASLRAWALREFPVGHEAAWFELAGAASASLTIHALLALSSKAQCSEADLIEVQGAYFPWIAAATTMLDSYVDQAEDELNKDHSYVVHYQTPELAARQVGGLIRRCMNEASALPDGERHALIAGCMVAMYLSKDSAHTCAMRETTMGLVHAGGSLTRLLLPILRLWRIAYGQRST
jgi:tetraprenyl-beta-curcumene synthase